jgi:peptide/nickel transport system permease protein
VLAVVMRKVGEALGVVLAVTLGSAALLNLIPGSAADVILGPNASKEQIATLSRQLGLDKPFWQRYWDWIVGCLHGDLGTSVQKGTPVTGVIRDGLPVTLEIAILSLALSLLVAIPIAIVCAARRESPIDRGLRGLCSGLLSAPSFVSCVVLTIILSTQLNVLPSFGWVAIDDNLSENLKHAGLSVIALILVIAPLFVRVLRADLIAVLSEDFILSARARGLPDRYIMFRHALRPASTSLFTLTGLVFGFLVGGSIILETFFSLPGLGNAIGQAVNAKDLPVIQGVVVLMAILYVVVNGLVDVGIRVLDPRTGTDS